MKKFLTTPRFTRVDAVGIAAAAQFIGGGDWAQAFVALVITYAIGCLLVKVQ